MKDREVIIAGINRRQGVKSNVKEPRINDEIRAEKVRLVSDGEPQIVSLKDALSIADKEGLDLVEIASNQDMPIVKVMDYAKYKFEQVKKAKEAKKKQRVIHVKEIKVRPRIDKHDYDHKIKHARSFLEKGDKVKFSMMFRGREIVHTELGKSIMSKILEDLEDCVTVEKEAALEGKNLIMILAPAAGATGPKNKNKAN